MEALVEVMNTALFYREGQLLERVLVKWLVCTCVHLCVTISSLHEGKCQKEGQLETSLGRDNCTI